MSRFSPIATQSFLRAAAVAVSLAWASALPAAPKADQPNPASLVPPPATSILPAPQDPHPAAAADGWKVETVMLHPQINSPSVVCALPDGRVLVAEDPMDNYGNNGPGDRIVCIHPDGHVTLFADHLYAVFGLAYVDGKVYVHHMPRFTVFTDDNGVGKDPVELFTQTNKYVPGLNDHIPAQIRLAMDGYFYMATGDKGVFGAKSNVDGRTAELHGGGLLRFRPDGTGLEVYATGTRNHLDVSINAEDEMFTYDNTDDGHGWWTRFTHMVDGGYYGYPWDYKPTEDKADRASRQTPKVDPNVPFQPFTLWRIAEYGGGSPCGATGYTEDALPEEYRQSVFHCEWGKGKVERFQVERDGASFKVVKHEDFLTNGKGGRGGGDLRPLGICPTVDGTGFWVTDWGYGGWMAKPPREAGRLLKVTWTGKSQAAPKPEWFVPAATGKKFDATTADLIAGLKHPAESVRLVAQRRLTERGQEAVAPLVALLNDASAPAFARWFAVWTFDRIDGGKGGREAILAAAKDPKADVSIRRQAIRELGQERATEATGAIVATLKDPDLSIRFRAATALGRIGDPAAVPALLQALAEESNQKDLFERFSLFTALNRIGRNDPKAWPAIVKGLESSSEAVRANVGYALRDTYDAALVKALADEAATSQGGSAQARAAAIGALAELHRQPKPWDGQWWATQPVGGPRPPKVVEWAGTPTILAIIRDAIRDADPTVRQAAIHAMAIAPDPAAGDTLVVLFNQQKNTDLRKTVLEALAAAKSPKGAELVASVLKEPAANAELLPAAIDVAKESGGKAAVEALVALVEANPDPKVLAQAIEALGEMKAAPASPAIAKQAGSAQGTVALVAVTALGQTGGEPATQALVAALDDKRPDVRRAAAESLGNLKAPVSAVPALVKVSKEKDGRVAEAAISALCRAPNVDALDAYLIALGGKNAGMREKASKALTTIADQAKPLLEAKAEAGGLSPEALAAVQNVYSTFTPLTVWQIIGPFAQDKPDPIDGANPASYPTKTAELKNVDGKPAKWKPVKTTAEHGMIEVGSLVSPTEHVNAFLLAEFNSSSDRDVEFVVGSDDTDIVWLNGQKIDEDLNDGGWSFDERRIKAHVKAGKNIVLARAGNSGGGWEFSLAISGERKGKLFEPVAGKKPDRAAYEQFAASNKGNPDNGSKIFHNTQTVGCVKCHQVNPTDGGTIGPSLQGVGVKYDRAKLVESLLYPSKQIFDGYEQWAVKTKDGEVQWGVIRSEDDKEIVMYDSAANKTVLRKADVASRKKSDVSLMPEGLEQGMTPQEFADLIAYLEGLKEKPPEAPKGAK